MQITPFSTLTRKISLWKSIQFQPACWKSTITTLENVWNMFKDNNKDTRTTLNFPCWIFYFGIEICGLKITKTSRKSKQKLTILCHYQHSHKKQIVWKLGPNWPFYALNPFFFTRHQNVHKPKSRAARTVYGLIFLPFYKTIVRFFLFYQTKQDQTVL